MIQWTDKDICGDMPDNAGYTHQIAIAEILQDKDSMQSC